MVKVLLFKTRLHVFMEVLVAISAESWFLSQILYIVKSKMTANLR